MLCEKNISLREITLADTENIVKWRNQPFVLKNFIDQTILTSQMHLTWYNTRIATKNVYQFIIHDSLSNQDIGSVFLRDVDLAHKNAEFGIFIGEETALGKGYGTLACKLICKFGFEKLSLEKIFLRVLEKNTAAKKAYSKSGFKTEGVFKKHLLLNNEFESLEFMALLKEDFNIEKEL